MTNDFADRLLVWLCCFVIAVSAFATAHVLVEAVFAQAPPRAALLSRTLAADGLRLSYLIESAAPPVVDGAQATLLAQTTVSDGGAGYRSTIAVRVGCGGALVVAVAGEQVVIERRWCGLLPVVAQ